MTNIYECDCCIIGGGFSGLMAASELEAKDVKIVVVEARSRFGGRTFTENNIDLGGQWVGPGQTMLLDLCNKFDLELVDQEYLGSGLKSSQAVSTLVECANFQITSGGEKHVEDFIRFVDQCCLELDLHQPW